MNIDARSYFPVTMTKEDIFGAATVACPAAQYTLIGSYTVAADELVGIGRGGMVAQNEAIGRLFATFFDTTGTPVQLTQGKFRVQYSSSQNMPIGSKPVQLDVDLAAITTGSTAPSERYVLPFDNTLLAKDRVIQFYIYNGTSSSVTLSKANSTVMMDCTRALV